MTAENPATPNRASARFTTRLHYRLAFSLAPVIDALGMLAIAWGCYMAAAGFGPEAREPHTIAAIVFTILVIVALEIQGLYNVEVLLPPRVQIGAIVFTSLSAFAALLAFGYAVNGLSEISLVWCATTFAGGISFLCLYRLVIHDAALRSIAAGRLSRNIVLVGFGARARQLVDRMRSGTQPWNRIVAVYEDHDEQPEDTSIGRPVLHDLEELAEFVRRREIDDVVIGLAWNDEARISAIVTRLAELPVNVHLGSEMAARLFDGPTFDSIGSTQVLKVKRKPLEGRDWLLKYCEDKILGLLVAMAFGLPMLLIALAIRLESRGPVFFRQARYGFNNRIFHVYKFRTMYHDRPPDTGVPQATRDDPRVTKVGRLLRRTSLDELPQVFNVLQGSMSLVGPRPHAVAHNEEYAEVIRGYYSRHRVKPGITGWAQVNGLRGETDTLDKMADRVRFDVFYIENWSLAFDIEILFRTISVGFVHRNAY